MSTYIIRRTLQGIPVLIGVSIIIFVIINLAPGDPVGTMINPNISADDIAEKRESLGLNDSMLVRYLKWARNVLQGDLGRSMKPGRKRVNEMISQRIGPTLVLALSSMVISWLFAVPIGVLSAVKQYSLGDYIATVLVFVGLSLPSFFFGLVLIYIFALKIPILPTGGMSTPGADIAVLDFLKHLILPAFALGFRGIASLTRYMRSSMLEVVKQDYIRTARSKGLAEKVVVYKHALRNAMIPIVTIFGLQIPFLFSGSIITEQIFAWPGMGRLGIGAVFGRDYPVIMAVNMLFALLVFLGNLIADVLYATVDPRIRFD